MENNQALYPIREVSRLTGINSITLRAWERRYGLVEPVRTDSGHRLYTDEHIQQIHKAVALTQQGVPISRVKSLLDASNESYSEAVPAANRKVLEPSETMDFLIQPLKSLNSIALEQAIDQLLGDFPETQAYKTLLALSLQCTEWTAAERVLWHSVLEMRLQARLRNQLRALGNKSVAKSLVFDVSSPACKVVQSLVRLHYASKGILSFVVDEAELDLSSQAEKTVLELFKSLGCDSVCLLSLSELSDAQEAFWCDWSRRFSSVEIEVCWSAKKPEKLLALVQNQSRPVENLF